LFFALSINNVMATSGACSWHGGVNCAAGADWDGSVICNDGWRNSSVSYHSMVKCQGYYDYNFPSYTPSIPDCPFNSYYDSLTSSCKCYSGYIVSGEKCISTDQYCQDLLGFNARYDILTDSCECSYGYVISRNRCVRGDTLCHNKYGIFSSYDSLSKTCECDYGYIFNSNDQCVSKDNYCRDLYGYNSEFNSLTDKCVCKRGHVFNSSMTECIDGDFYCRGKYGYHASYDYWGEVCKCDDGYMLSGNKCIAEDAYCHSIFGIHSSYNTLTEDCACNYGYKFKDGKCVTPEISGIFPLEAEIDEKVTIQGKNFGSSKYNDLKLYIGSIKVSLSDISKWQDSKIVFEVGDYLESGFVVLKDNTINIRGSYLEISEPEEDYIPIYSFTPTKEKITVELKPQPSEETQLEPQSLIEESQPSEFQELKEEEWHGRSNIVISNQQEQGQGQKKSVWIFLANILTAAQNFFVQFFR